MSPENEDIGSGNVVPLFGPEDIGKVAFIAEAESKEVEAEQYQPPQTESEAIAILQLCETKVKRARLFALDRDPVEDPGVVNLNRYRRDQNLSSPIQAKQEQKLADIEARQSAKLFDGKTLPRDTSVEFYLNNDGEWIHEKINTVNYYDGHSPQINKRIITYRVEGGELKRQSTSGSADQKPTLKQIHVLCDLAYRYANEIIAQVYYRQE